MAISRLSEGVCHLVGSDLLLTMAVCSGGFEDLTVLFAAAEKSKRSYISDVSPVVDRSFGGYPVKDLGLECLDKAKRL